MRPASRWLQAMASASWPTPLEETVRNATPWLVSKRPLLTNFKKRESKPAESVSVKAASSIGPSAPPSRTSAER